MSDDDLTPNGFDYIIVGGGTAGCVVASRICESSSADVCLIEAGPRDRSIVLRVPALGFLANSNPKFLQRDVTEPDPELDGRRMTWTHGRVVGGSSSVNGMVYTRGHSSEYDAWNCPGWSFRDLLPLFRRAETSERGANEWHGDAGPIKIRKGRATVPIAEIFLQAADDAGISLVDDLNADAPEGFGHFDHTIGHGRRSSTSASYLQTLTRRGRLTVLPRTTVLRVAIEHGCAKGVDILDRGGRPRRLAASREVIVCAGTINSPQLLMLSGIGPPGQLEMLDIDVVAPSCEVGKNLQNHVRIALRYSCEAEVTAYSHLKPRSLIGGLARYALTRDGILSESVISTGGSLRSDPSCSIADLKVTLFDAMMGSAGGRLGMLPERHGFSVSVNQGTPCSRGEISLRSADPLRRPLIFPRNFSEPCDLEILEKGVTRLREIMSGPSMRRIGAAEIGSGASSASREDLRREIRACAANVYHDIGTCRMGTDPDSVVDERLFVRGIERLRVADASVIPRLLNANTNAAVVAIGEKAAALVLARNNVGADAQ